MTDDFADVLQQKNLVNLRRMSILLFPLFATGVTLIVLLMGIKMNFESKIIASFVYGMVLLAYYRRIHQGHKTTIFAEYVNRNNDRKSYFTTPLTDKGNLPIRDGGFIYAIPMQEEFSKPFPLQFHLVTYGRDIDLNTVYKCSIGIGEKTYCKSIYGGDDLIHFKREVIRDFESNGYHITAIKNRYGDCLWALSDTSTKPLRVAKIYYSFLNLVVPALFGITTIIPVLAIWLQA